MMNSRTPWEYAYKAAWPCLSWAAMSTAAVVLLLGVLMAALAILHVMFQHRQIRAMPDDVPWVGLDDYRFLPKLRATLASWTRGTEFVAEAWDKVRSAVPSILPRRHCS
jgi:hypothetical protein